MIFWIKSTVGFDPRSCSLPDGRPGRCMKPDSCLTDLDYSGFSDETYCITDKDVCCPISSKKTKYEKT